VANLVSTAITMVLVAGKQAAAAVSKDLVATDPAVRATLKVAVVPIEDEVVLAEAVVATAADVDRAVDAPDSIKVVRDLVQ
jgi:ABC-type phosphate/phosphonate transport system substrate-binding protein